jgi:hypothetical protein
VDLHNHCYKKLAQYSEAIADMVMPKPLPKPLCYMNFSVMQQKITSPNQWVTNSINESFAKYHKFSAKQVWQTYQLFIPDDNLTVFVIKDGQVTLTNRHPGMNEACTYALKLYKEIFGFLAEKQYVKNLTFLLRLTDVTTTDFSKNVVGDIAPVLAVTKDTSKHIDQDSILIPDYYNLTNWGRLQPKIARANVKFPWEQKINTILWRGRPADVTGYRHNIVQLSKDLGYEKIDARFTYGKNTKEKYLAPEDHVAYKFQITIDGHTAAWERPVWQLYSNSVVLKQQSPRNQWYYDAIKPGIHYIQVSNDPKDLLNITNIYTDAELKTIADNGHEFAKDNLTIEDMMAYIILVLQKYEQLQNAAERGGASYTSQAI